MNDSYKQFLVSLISDKVKIRSKGASKSISSMEKSDYVGKLIKKKNVIRESQSSIGNNRVSYDNWLSKVEIHPPVVSGSPVNS